MKQYNPDIIFYGFRNMNTLVFYAKALQIVGG